MMLFVAASVGSVYIAISKTYVEQTLPKASQLDEWTENRTLWTPTPIANHDDYIDGTYYGNKSMEFSIANGTQIWMQLNNTEPVNCSGVEGYKNMSFRIKFICPATTELTNASLLLYSSPADYFYYNLTKHFTPLNITVWNNLTIPAGSESGSWLNGTTQADWGNITRLRFEFTWPENTNATVRLDGLFFRGVFKSVSENAISIMLYSVYPPGLLQAFMQFTILWVVLSGILYVMAKAFGGKTVWRPLLILVGFALITLFIQAVIYMIAYATVPTLYYRLEFLGGVKGEFEVAYEKIIGETWLFYQISNYVQIVVSIWTIALCAIAVRLLAEFSWTRSIIVSTVAYFVSMLAESLLLGY